MASENEGKRETLAAIAAEIRSYGDRPPPKCAWLDIADRIEAIDSADAWRSLYTPGNAAAMREALEMARDALKSAEKYVYGDPPDGGAIGWDDVWPSEWHNALEAVERAISAPARNCDAMSRSMCTTHFSTTYEGNRDGLCDVQTEREKNIHLYYMELIDWIFAPAAERKGEGDGK